MTFNELVANVANIEGKKLEEHVGNIRESLSILSDLIYNDPDVLLVLLENGKRRRELSKEIEI